MAAGASEALAQQLSGHPPYVLLELNPDVKVGGEWVMKDLRLRLTADEARDVAERLVKLTRPCDEAGCYA